MGHMGQARLAVGSRSLRVSSSNAVRYCKLTKPFMTKLLNRINTLQQVISKLKLPTFNVNISTFLGPHEVAEGMRYVKIQKFTH